MELAHYIDHTLLKPTATITDTIQLCLTAKKYGFYAVCVNGCHVALAKNELMDSKVKLATVVGFPLGAASTKTKIQEALDSINNGADEIDMVLNIGWMKSNRPDLVKKEISEVKRAIGHKVLKVILETCYLTERKKKKACESALQAKADFVKTSTGFGPGNATFEDILLMKKVVGEKVGIKASGGIKNSKTALRYIELGATRIGTSAGVALVTDI